MVMNHGAKATAKSEPIELDSAARWKVRRPGLTPSHLLVHDVEIGITREWTADSTLGITDVSAEQIVANKERILRESGDVTPIPVGERRPGHVGDAGARKESEARDFAGDLQAPSVTLSDDGLAVSPDGRLGDMPRDRPGALRRDRFSTLPREGLGSLRNEARQLQAAKEQYGWMEHLRLPNDVEDPRKVRWIHISSKFPEDIQGVFVGLTDWRVKEKASLEAYRQIGLSIRANERFSHHGKFFTPFVQQLESFRTQGKAEVTTEIEHQPVLASFPFLDWTIYPGPAPPARFQLDDREKYASSKRSAHPFCSLLQHYYHLEDTSDRERSQVYSKHKPWSSDRDLDLRVRRFYRHYPSGLGVDELWILIIDRKHIVTFSSNQSWKTRFPQLQLADRIADISFHSLRPTFEDFDQEHSYDTLMQAIVCIHGAVSLTHRGFWSALPLPCIDRYAGYFGHLKFRLYRAASTKLVLDLLQLQDELNIVVQIMKSQLNVIRQHVRLAQPEDESPTSPSKRFSIEHRIGRAGSPESSQDRGLYAIGPATDMVDNLEREMNDLNELRNNTSELVNRTVQLVNLRLEDHGQAILVFTLVTVIFLPLSFLSSFFGMNVTDIRNTNNTQWVFWASAVALTAVVVAASCGLAFFGSRLLEWFVTWKETNWHNLELLQRLRRRREPPAPLPVPGRPQVQQQGFTVLDVAQVEATLDPSW